MKRYFFPLLFALIAFGCSHGLLKEYDDDCDYSDCQTQEPFYTEIYIDFTKIQPPDKCEIYVFQSVFENSSCIDTIQTDSSVRETIIYPHLTLTKRYYIAAKYIISGDTILAIDSKIVEKTAYTECDSVCWKIKNQYFNVKLKNY